MATRSGSKHLVGKSAIITKVDTATAFGAFMCVTRAIIVSPEFVHYFYESLFFRNQLEEANTTTIYQVTQKMLKKTILALPPLSEQEKIAKEIQHYFHLLDIIDQNQSDLQQLSEQLRQKVLDVAMQGKLVAQDPNDEPASVLLEKIRAEKQRLFEEGKLKKKDLIEIEPVLTDDNAYYRNLPESWEVSTLGNIINLISGRDLRINKIIEQPDLEGIPYITGASDFHDGTVVTNRQTLEPQVTSEIGDILITVKGTVGKLGINPYFKAHIARQVMAISPYVLDKIFLQYFLLYKIFEIKSQSQSMIPGISREVLLKLTIQLPPKEEQKRISNFIQLVFEVIDQVN